MTDPWWFGVFRQPWYVIGGYLWLVIVIGLIAWIFWRLERRKT